jgi:hypothetical protein
MSDTVGSRAALVLFFRAWRQMMRRYATEPTAVIAFVPETAIEPAMAFVPVAHVQRFEGGGVVLGDESAPAIVLWPEHVPFAVPHAGDGRFEVALFLSTLPNDNDAVDAMVAQKLLAHLSANEAYVFSSRT